MSKSAENNGLDRWERNYFVSVMSSQFRGAVYICKDQQQRKMCLKTEETKTWGWKCSNVSPNLPKLTHPKYVLSIILYWFCLFLIDEFDLDSLLNGGGISSFADVYQKLKVCCWFFWIFFSCCRILYLRIILQLFWITHDLRCLTRFRILGFSSTSIKPYTIASNPCLSDNSGNNEQKLQN